jgi:hypothetical protein
MATSQISPTEMQKITLTLLFGCRLTDGVKGLASDAEEVDRGF